MTVPSSYVIVVVTEPLELVDDVSDLIVVDEDELPEALPDWADEEPDEDALDEVLEDDADVEDVCVCAVCWVK